MAHWVIRSESVEWIVDIDTVAHGLRRLRHLESSGTKIDHTCSRVVVCLRQWREACHALLTVLSVSTGAKYQDESEFDADNGIDIVVVLAEVVGNTIQVSPVDVWVHLFEGAEVHVDYHFEADDVAGLPGLERRSKSAVYS